MDGYKGFCKQSDYRIFRRKMAFSGCTRTLLRRLQIVASLTFLPLPLIGFRDFLAHHYETVILDRIWDAVEDLPTLRSKIESVMNTVNSENEN